MKRTKAILGAATALLLLAAAPAGASYELVGQWGSQGTGDAQFQSLPDGGLATDSQGNVYVSDRLGYRIRKFDPDGTFLTKWVLRSPRGIAIDSKDNVYVADTADIRKFDSSGNLITEWGSSGDGEGQFGYGPHSIAIDSQDNVYAADGANGRMQKFDSEGTFLSEWPSAGTGDGQNPWPDVVATDSSDDVYVVNHNHERIVKFDSDGNFIAKWGIEGSGEPGCCSSPSDIAVDSQGNVYAAEEYSDRIQKFDSIGNFQTMWGSSGAGVGQFAGPNAVATDSQGNVYVSDSRNYRVQKFKFIDAPPETTITSGPPDLSHVDSATFAFSSNPVGSRYECRLDSEAFVPCSSPLTHSDLSDAPHSFSVRAIDVESGADPTPAERAFETDTPPDTRIDSGPPDRIADASPLLAFSSDQPGSTYECRIGGAAFTTCAPPKPYSDLSDGLKALKVRAVDPAGNRDPTPAAWRFTVDTRIEGLANAKRTQFTSGRRVTVRVWVTAREELTAHVSGKVKVNPTYGLKPKTASVESGTATLRLVPEKRKGARRIARALKRGGKAKAKLKIELTDGVGNTEVDKVQVKLKRRPRVGR